MGLLPPNLLRFLQRMAEAMPTKCCGIDLHKGRLGLAKVTSFQQKSSSYLSKNFRQYSSYSLSGWCVDNRRM
jgi:hypothetical protein